MNGKCARCLAGQCAHGEGPHGQWSDTTVSGTDCCGDCAGPLLSGAYGLDPEMAEVVAWVRNATPFPAPRGRHVRGIPAGYAASPGVIAP